jgi:hypothetical protein
MAFQGRRQHHHGVMNRQRAVTVVVVGEDIGPTLRPGNKSHAIDGSQKGTGMSLGLKQLGKLWNR